MRAKYRPEQGDCGIFHLQVLTNYLTQVKLVVPEVFSRSFLVLLNNFINGASIASLEKITYVKPHCHYYYLPCSIKTKLRYVR